MPEKILTTYISIRVISPLIDLRSLVKFESFAIKTKFTNNSRQFALKINLRKLRKFVKFAVKKINEQFTAILPFRALSTAEIKSNLAKNVKKTLRQHKPIHRTQPAIP